MKGIYYLICLVVWFFGATAGFGYCIYIKEPVTALAIVALAAMAFPYARKCWKALNGGDSSAK